MEKTIQKTTTTRYSVEFDPEDYELLAAIRKLAGAPGSAEVTFTERSGFVDGILVTWQEFINE